MKNLKSLFSFNKEERSGIFYLLLLIIILQIFYFVVKTGVFRFSTDAVLVHNKKEQLKIDSLKEKSLGVATFKIYPMNPNYITDYKGYVLGMSVAEIDRLHAFRTKNKYVNSAVEFQKVTKVTDSLLNQISPYFKFPEWIKKKENKTLIGKFSNTKKIRTNKKIIRAKDINTTTAIDLQIVRGIGKTLSTRIIKFRDKLGGFLVSDQLYDVYGLEDDVVKRVLKYYTVINKPNIKPININVATAFEISKLIYIRYGIAKKIVEYREENGSFISLDDLVKIEGFPSDKIIRIKLYLSLD